MTDMPTCGTRERPQQRPTCGTCRYFLRGGDEVVTWSDFPACPTFQPQTTRNCTNCARHCPRDGFEACEDWQPVFGCWYSTDIEPDVEEFIAIDNDDHMYIVSGFPRRVLLDWVKYWMSCPPRPEEVPK